MAHVLTLVPDLALRAMEGGKGTPGGFDNSKDIMRTEASTGSRRATHYVVILIAIVLL